MRYLVLILLLNVSTTVTSYDIKTTHTFALKSVFFDFNSYKYRDSLHEEEFKSEYKALKLLLDENQELILKLHGFQNNREQANLATRRALKIRDDMIRTGCKEQNIIMIVEPIVAISDSTDETEKLLSQRVSFTLEKLK